MDASTTTAGFTFAAATPAELEEFRRVREHLPLMMAAWRVHSARPVFGQRARRLRLVREREADTAARLTEEWSNALVAVLCQALVENRPASPLAPINPREDLEPLMAAGTILRFARLACERRYDRGFLAHWFVRDDPRPGMRQAVIEEGRAAYALLMARMNGPSPHQARQREVIAAVHRRVGDLLFPHALQFLPESFGPDDFDHYHTWVRDTARDWDGDQIARLLAGRQTEARDAEDLAERLLHRCWLELARFTYGCTSEVDDLAKMGVWAWSAVARMEMAAQATYAQLRVPFEVYFLPRPDRRLLLPSFWQFLLAGAGAVPAEQLAEGIQRFVLSPRTLPRWAVPGDAPAGKLKHVFRELSDLAQGDVRETVQFRHLAARVQSREAALPERLALFGQYIAFAFERTQPADTKLRATVERLLHAALRDAETILANADCVLCPVRLQSPDDVAFNALLAAEAEEARQANDEFQCWMAEALRPGNASAGAGMPAAEGGANDDNAGAELPPEEPVALRYVDNFGAEQWRVWDFASARERLGGDLEAFLAEHGIESVVPARSVAEALRHFLYELTPEQRRELPLEKIAGMGWRKMKRGGQRIYVLERDGSVYFHLLKRRDWVHADLLEARY